MFSYGAGLVDGMFIQAAAEQNFDNERIAEQWRGFRLAVKLMQEGCMETLDLCLNSPEDIDFYCSLHDIN